MMMNKPDLDSPERIEEFVNRFYDKVLKDEALAPIFLDVAGIDIREHFPRIRAYWEKLLLGHNDYHRHTMNIHRDLHHKRPLLASDFDRWLSLFVTTVDENYEGAKAERAKLVAEHIATNMLKAVRKVDEQEAASGQS